MQENLEILCFSGNIYTHLSGPTGKNTALFDLEKPAPFIYFQAIGIPILEEEWTKNEQCFEDRQNGSLKYDHKWFEFPLEVYLQSSRTTVTTASEKIVSVGSQKRSTTSTQ